MNRRNSDPADFALDRRQIRQAFERASQGYDRAAVLQTSVRGELLERLQYAKLDPTVILDAGAGTGHASRSLKRRFRRAQVIALDLAFGMLQAAGKQRGWLSHFERVCADAVDRKSTRLNS